MSRLHLRWAIQRHAVRYAEAVQRGDDAAAYDHLTAWGEALRTLQRLTGEV